MKVACIQFDIKLSDVQNNIERMCERIDEVCATGANIIVLPELWTTGYCLESFPRLVREHENVISILQKKAKKNGVHLVAGSIPTKAKEKFYNTLIIINADGEVVKKYNKVHLFKLMDEHLYLHSGSDNGLFQLENIVASGIVCYDLRFPEWIRLHALKGASILFVVAEWPTPRISQWRIMLQSRAIENQCYVVGCNRVGNDENNDFGGHSMIIDPYGEVIAEGGNKEEIIVGEIDATIVEKARNFIPILNDRQKEVYETFEEQLRTK